MVHSMLAAKFLVYFRVNGSMSDLPCVSLLQTRLHQSQMLCDFFECCVYFQNRHTHWQRAFASKGVHSLKHLNYT